MSCETEGLKQRDGSFETEGRKQRDGSFCFTKIALDETEERFFFLVSTPCFLL